MTKMKTNRASPAKTDWTRELAARLVKESVPGELEGFSAADRKAAAAVANRALARRLAGQTGFEIESFVSATGMRLMRLAIVNDDMPFLVDSIAALIAGHGLVIHRLLHPVLSVERSADGQLESLGKGGLRESLIYIECERGDARTRMAIRRDVVSSLAAVRLAVEDWPHLKAALRADAERLEGEARDFLNWAADDHFTLLGAEAGQPLGLARAEIAPFLSPAAHRKAIELFRETHRDLLIIKSSLISPVHRPVPLDLLIVPIRNGAKVSAIHIHAGLWTSNALAAEPQQVPLLAGRLARLQQKFGFDPAGHAGKALTHAITELPSDIAVSIDEAALEQLALTAMSIADRPRVAVAIVSAPLNRHLFAFVWLPRDELTTSRRVGIGEMIGTAAQGSLLNWSVSLGDGGAALLRYVFDIRAGAAIPDQDDIRMQIDTIVRGWASSVEAELTHLVEGGSATRLALRYALAFPESYRETAGSKAAASDIVCLQQLDTPTRRLARFDARPGGSVGLKLYTLSPVSLSETVPVLENFGFTVAQVDPTMLAGQSLGLINDFTLGLAHAEHAASLSANKAGVEDALAAVLEGRAENDLFNSLMVSAGLDARSVLLFRALFRYLRQTGMAYGQQTFVAALDRYPAIARALVSLFHAMHDPAAPASRDAHAETSRQIDKALTNVVAIDDDRILRQMRAVIVATVRTNMFSPAAAEAIAFKIDSARVPGLPAPVPWREVFVYSPRVEGIHLRAGPVARGGLRWSDRRDDFRTEILGLMKAQRVKNAVIVPTGAKGGFYPKQLPDPSNRDAWIAEGTESYRIFIRTLLSITDNLVKGKVVHPQSVRCHDGDDPYFVVAADKGTATFSDVANALALEQNFWLGDAFASGGSVGYDHKAMGITAKGGWVSVRRHFSEMGMDIQAEPIEVAGCGDMSGDVFGNGMLLSKAIKLVAAFDHRHIFIDPNPDPQLSWKERKRLFALPRSSWADYDTRLLSKGGGVFPRSAKSIPLSREMRQVLGTDATALDPSALIAAILRAPVGLLWFGGIGTYVKARSESNADVGDRANEAHRVNAEELRCSVIGEGANLGVTQAGRIAFALHGGRINTDFIDNSAGVDCSDNEVNIKIALGTDVASGRLSTHARNRLLVRMTDDVAALVLEDNRLQTLALSIAGRDGARDVPAHIRLMETFEARGQLDRAVEGIASNDELLRRAAEGQGLTRPELAVLLATAKLALQEGIEATRLGNDAAALPDLLAAFPIEMRRKHADAIRHHQLRPQIIATKIANRIVNRMGIVHPFELAEEEGATLGSVAEAFLIAEAIYGMGDLWTAVDGADVPEATRLMLFEQIAIEMRAHMADILRNSIEERSNDKAIAAYAPTVRRLSEGRNELLPTEARRQTEAFGARLVAAGTPRKLADQLVRLAQLDGAIGLSALAARSKVDVIALTRGFTALGEALGIDWAQGVAMQLDPEDPWERLLVAGLARDFQAMRLEFLHRAGGKKPTEAVAAWRAASADRIAAFRSMIDRARKGAMPSPAMLAQIAGQARVLLSR